MPVQQGQTARFEIVLERRRQVSVKLRGDEGHEARSITVLCNKEGVENPSTCGQCVIGFLLLISASAHQQFVVMLKNILKSPSSKEADTLEEEGTGITHGNLFRTYKRECRLSLSHSLSLSLSPPPLTLKTQVRSGVNKKIFKPSLPRQSH